MKFFVASKCSTMLQNHALIRAVTTIFILGGGGLEVTIGGGLTMVEAEELKHLF